MHVGLGKFRETFEAFCHPDLLRSLLCEQLCEKMTANPDCTQKCVEGATLVHALRERICHLISPSTPPEAELGDGARLLARTFIHFQSSILLTMSLRSAHAGWRASNTGLEFFKNLALPVAGVAISLTGFGIAIIL